MFGCGIDRVYPVRHRALSERVRGYGVLVSEFPLGTPPRGIHFPQRNRLISGLSIGTVVVAAAERSGSIITARYALEQGREVFAVPRRRTRPVCTGLSRAHKARRQAYRQYHGPYRGVFRLVPLAQTLQPSISRYRNLAGTMIYLYKPTRPLR